MWRGLSDFCSRRSFAPFESQADPPGNSETSLSHTRRCSYLEIYNEQVFDLLVRVPSLGRAKLGPSPLVPPTFYPPDKTSIFKYPLLPPTQAPGGSDEHLNVREDSKRGVFAEGAAEELVQSAAGTYEVFHRGSANRRVAETGAGGRNAAGRATRGERLLCVTI